VLIGGTGAHSVVPATEPSAATWAGFSATASALSDAAAPCAERAKKRNVGRASSRHIDGDVAVAPRGSDREYCPRRPVTANGSLPLTSFAPPVSVQPLVDSSVPFGASS
jgi:hypothetical protein